MASTKCENTADDEAVQYIHTEKAGEKARQHRPRRHKSKKKKKEPAQVEVTSPADIGCAFSAARQGLEESEGRRHDRDWRRLESKHLELSKINARREELWQQLQKVFPQRDYWLQQFEAVEAKGQSVIEDDRLRGSKGSRAIAASRQCWNLATAHRMHRRRLRQLNDQVTAISAELCELEEKYPLTDQDRLDELFRAAVEDDAPKAMLEILRRVKQIRLNRDDCASTPQATATA